MIVTAVTEVIDELVCGDPGSLAKRLKIFLPQEIVTIADPVIAVFFQATVTFDPQ